MLKYQKYYTSILNNDVTLLLTVRKKLKFVYPKVPKSLTKSNLEGLLYFI